MKTEYVKEMNVLIDRIVPLIISHIRVEKVFSQRTIFVGDKAIVLSDINQGNVVTMRANIDWILR